MKVLLTAMDGRARHAYRCIDADLVPSAGDVVQLASGWCGAEVSDRPLWVFDGVPHVELRLGTFPEEDGVLAPGWSLEFPECLRARAEVAP